MQRVGVTVLAVALIATACSDESSATAGASSDTAMVETETGDDQMMHRSPEHIPAATGPVTSEYVVSLSEFSFGQAEFDLTPGETVRFVLVNDGALDHEFRLTTEHKAGEHLAAGHATHETEGHHAEADIVVFVAAGETRVVETTLPEATGAIDQIACLIPGHYESGMLANVDF